MIALFHSPVIGQAGCNSAVAAMACVASSKFKQRILVLQLRDNVTPIEKLLFKKEIASKTIKREEDAFEDTGIDALLIRSNVSLLKPEDFKNFSVSSVTHNKNLDIVGVTKKTAIEPELNGMFKNVVNLLEKADSMGIYDWIFVVAPGTHSSFTQSLLATERLNMVSVMCVPQNAMIIEKEAKTSEFASLFKRQTKEIQKKKYRTLLLVGNFDVDSKYSPRNIAAGYGFRQDRICSILHDAHFKDSLSQGDLFNFIMKNLENDVDDDIYSFSKYLVEATGKLLIQESREGKIVYTDPLPDRAKYVHISIDDDDESYYSSDNVNAQNNETTLPVQDSYIDDDDICMDEMDEFDD